MLERMQSIQKVVDAHMLQPFIWCERDCATVAADAVRSLNPNHTLPVWPKYKNAVGALRAVKKMGYESLNDAVTNHLTPITDGTRFIGDILTILAEGEMDALAVYLGGNAVMVPVDGMFIRGDLTFYTGSWWGIR